MYAADDVVDNQKVRLCLEIGGTTRYLSASDNWLTLGRAKASDVILASSAVSRNHARIGWHDGNFVLIDQSANGTFVRIVGQETHIRRQEMLLFGSGEICCGAHALTNRARRSSDSEQKPEHACRRRLEQTVW